MIERRYTSMLRKALMMTGGAALLLSLLLICALGQAYHARVRGTAFLSDVRRLRVGQSTYDDVLRIKTKYDGRSWSEDKACDQDQCIVNFSFDNKWLYRFGLVPGTGFIGGLTVRKGILVRIDLALQSNPKFDAMMDEIPAEPDVLVYEVGGKQLISRPAYSYVWAHITSAASQDERQKVYAFNLKCLTKWGGCKDSNELLPILRHLSESEHGAPPPPPPD
jgi:hypothetical protein